MKRYLKLVVFLFLLVIIPVHVSADEFEDECDFSTKAKLKKLASNISTSYAPVETDSSMTFNVTISNIYQGLRLMDYTTNQVYQYDPSRPIPHEITITGLEPDQTYQFNVYSNQENCSSELLTTYYVTLPAYNPYYKNDLCNGIEDYKLCSKWLKHSMSYEEFHDQIMKYQRSLEKEEAESEEDNDLNPIFQFILDYYYVFIILGIIGIGYVIYVRNKRDSFGF